MKTDRILSSKGLAFQKPMGFGLPTPHLSRRLRSPSLVLLVSQSRYLRTVDRFSRLSRRVVFSAARPAPMVGV